MSSILKVDTIQDADGNNIINENGNTITIGASGDNITIPSGATFTSVGIDDNADATAITIDSSENVGIGTSSPAEKLDVYRSGSGITTRFGKDSIFGELRVGGDSVGFTGTRTAGTADNAISGYFINNDINSGTSRFEYLTLKTVNTERMRIDSSGNVLVSGDTYDADAQDLTVGMAAIGEDGRILVHSVGQPLELARTAGDTNGRAAIQFWREGNLVGSIETGGSSTTYNTSSDYRLKENVNYDFDATTRLKQLKPARFNFIADDTTTIDGFLAHEVSSVVPEAISGTKDAVQVWENGENLPEGVSVGDNKLDENGNTIPKYQGIDQSKLVPLLVKTIQELEARIKTLETKVQTLENNQP